MRDGLQGRPRSPMVLTRIANVHCMASSGNLKVKRAHHDVAPLITRAPNSNFHLGRILEFGPK